MGVYGQDWSSYQNSTPSARGLDFVFLKVTEGLTYVNPYWKSQMSSANSSGAVVGFYHYPHMHNNPDAEVNYFLSKVSPQIDQMVVLDWEGYDVNNRNLSPSEQLAYKEEYLRFLKSKLPNNPVGLYCNTDYWLRIDKKSHAGDFLWIATANKPAGQPGISDPWKFHQYGASGVDRDYGNFDSRDALKEWVHSFAPKKKPAPGGAIAHKVIMLPHIVKAAKTDPKAAQGHVTYAPEVKLVEAALMAEKLLDKRYATDGSFGSKTLEAYAAWQRHLGYAGKDANGIPGEASLTALGKKHGFTVFGG